MKAKKTFYFNQDLDTCLARQMIFGTLDGIVTNWFMNDCENQLVPLAKPVHQLLIQGLQKDMEEGVG